MKIEIVLNSCFGGFSLSNTGKQLLCKLKGWEFINIDNNKSSYRSYMMNNGIRISEQNLSRDDKDLVEVIKRLGVVADGDDAKLRIETIEFDINDMIESFDGREDFSLRY